MTHTLSESHAASGASSSQSTTGLDAISQAALVHRRALRPVDLVEQAIACIERLNPVLNAVITEDFERALETAMRMNADRPFAGVPILVKDLCAEVDGIRMCEGSAYLKDYVSRGDQEYVARLRRAGFVILGKTNTPEFGMAPTAEPQQFGATANPWDATRSAGGSSGGSAAAVASGMVPVAHGNDAGGSIRIPASVCGLFGLKPTRARNPLGPRYGDAFGGMVTEHVLTRSVRDSAALLDVTAGPAPGDPYNAPPHSGSWAAEVGRSPGRLRVAVTRSTADGSPVHPDVLDALDDTVELLVSLGHEVFDRDLTELTPEVGSAIGRMYGAAVDWAIRYWIRETGREPGRDELEPLTRLYWERGQNVSGGELLMAMTVVQEFSRALAAASDGEDGFDLWLSPTLAGPPPRLGELVASGENPHEAEATAAAWVSFPLVTANLTGRPAMSVPLHRNSEGLPIGAHLMGTFGGEAMLFRLAGQLEEARPWGELWPSVSAHTHHHSDENKET
ncbi:MAG: amidase [Nocardioidaceae bacterium]|nr:amidase [Nocardioidaceae bacterium]